MAFWNTAMSATNTQNDGFTTEKSNQTWSTHGSASLRRREMIVGSAGQRKSMNGTDKTGMNKGYDTYTTESNSYQVSLSRT